MMQNAARSKETLRKIYRTLSRVWGPQHWWPSESPFEVIVGTFLTQNTSWRNVERALESLRRSGALNVDALRTLPLADLEQLIHASGYYRQKAKRLKMFVAYLDRHHGGSLEQMFATTTGRLREELLALQGVGPETADAILLYAARHEVFVADAYARRVLSRHDVISNTAQYDEVRELVQQALCNEKPPAEVAAETHFPEGFVVHTPSPMSSCPRSRLSQVYNEMHGLFVQVGKHYCRKTNPNCSACPLRPLLPTGRGTIDIR